MREWLVQARKGAWELWHGIFRWASLFTLVGWCIGILVSIIVIRDYPPPLMYVVVFLVSVFIAWVWFFHRKSLPHELEEADV